MLLDQCCCCCSKQRGAYLQLPLKLLLEAVQFTLKVMLIIDAPCRSHMACSLLPKLSVRFALYFLDRCYMLQLHGHLLIVLL